MNVFTFNHRFYEGKVFHNHPLAKHIAEKLLHVFVSIEMTGQSVAFEQKFNYRRPMYAVLEYIWEIPLHRKAIKVNNEISSSEFSSFTKTKKNLKTLLVTMNNLMYQRLVLGLFFSVKNTLF